MTQACRACESESVFVVRGRFMCERHFFVWLYGAAEMHGLHYRDRESAWKLLDALGEPANA